MGTSPSSTIQGFCEVCGTPFIRKVSGVFMPYYIAPTIDEDKIMKGIIQGGLSSLVLANIADRHLAMSLICEQCWPARWGRE